MVVDFPLRDDSSSNLPAFSVSVAGASIRNASAFFTQLLVFFPVFFFFVYVWIFFLFVRGNANFTHNAMGCE